MEIQFPVSSCQFPVENGRAYLCASAPALFAENAAAVCDAAGKCCDAVRCAVCLWRRRPEHWWGVLWLPEFWAVVFFGGAFLWNLRREWRNARVSKPA